MRLVMREKLRCAPAPEFLKLFGQLASDTELPVLQNAMAALSVFINR
jgi:hypothetical protein